ncbi:hypothetical protein [Pseudonocardia sp. GCM10023141]|uniref:hypothetical protein n=1 Tax=Pseudonocardia sp. GCM10023141 TaxID=3252653 RepID=UPI003616B5A1
MGWLLGQVWVLCVIAFLAGATVTWLAFVMPQRGAARSTVAGTRWAPDPVAGSDWESAHLAAMALGNDRPEPSDPPPAVDPALAALDGRGGGPPKAGPGVTATGALDLLGVARVTRPDIPAQGGPVDMGDDERPSRT